MPNADMTPDLLTQILPLTDSPTHLISAAVVAYLIGCIPFAVVVSRVFGLADPRSFGSGNPGATNVLRTGNKLAALLTLFGDAAKGAVAIGIAAAMGLNADLLGWIGLIAFLGHVFPVTLGFKGGKGVSTSAGVLLALHWPLGLATLGTWLFMAFSFRYSSLSAITAALMAPVLAVLMGLPTPVIVPVSLMAAILLIKHAGNLRRLLAGHETKIGSKKKAA
ncbi:glycerol-3-phosphate 1-O-acyltransferase PlsY [Fluviibacter phosphoraccumulans]|uniref:Glycerol-3-phosphate acyltransferase n=1 Tax=Fluviibacter phosphoraccumulans TaxID=1751046 RepID=A0A679I6Z1_9RHOO|nr:glycerol-3-phosphate 1-O-acyltransferase PlsY [Fluviibacter phosphoraccumulans]BBU68599.1 glycerol-3-phosphate acyltransferase [Fluviibacter phosphoraccumulans]BBU72246.1 glycerol-3-phosphate acyltransferase [Fluviibacter phosphoraccumulans]BCA64512.1 glycerol-3-phosphate acyltransferase [Fluviibacter phosphoraccumulans]